jgi:hypothetical protein
VSLPASRVTVPVIDARTAPLSSATNNLLVELHSGRSFIQSLIHSFILMNERDMIRREESGEGGQGA